MKHEDILKKMTLEEKAAILSGATTWTSREIKSQKIPSIFLSDGPSGVRKQEGAGDHLGLNASVPATCFPSAATMANSWNEVLGEEVGTALGEEAASMGVDVLLGPGLNMKRSPLCGRNFEYFCEDPYLAGKMAAAYVRGIQSQGIYACPKHFAVNSQEERRMAMNAVLDERTLREIYLTGFEIAIKESGAKTIMSSYNEVNGTYANENKHLLLDILREEWGFDGIVVTDWGASNDHVAGVAARSNLEMPAPGLDAAREVIAAVKDGSLTMDELDTCVDDLLDAILDLQEKKPSRPDKFDRNAHHELCRKAASESAVLLKNENKILPLKPGTKVAVIGDFAVEPRYQGAGSSMVNPTQIETIVGNIEQYPLDVVGISRGYQRTGAADKALKAEALRMAKQADVVLYFFGLDEMSESEGLDRTHLRIPANQIDLLKALAKVNKHVVGILSGGASIEMPWEKGCQALLHGYLNGQAGALAILDILTGAVNPSGHLNETYPEKYEDTPAFFNYPAKQRNTEHREGIYIGYRYYDTAKVPVKYPFGYGLSYTTFAYSELKVTEEGVSFVLTNTGDQDGAEVAQLYIGKPDAKVFRPARELKGFAKVFLKAGESREVRIAFDDKTFRYWNVKTNAWEIEDGAYEIMIGSHVADTALTGTIEKAGTTELLPYTPEELPSYYTGKIHTVENEEFEKLLGTPIPDGSWSGELGLNDAFCQLYYAKNPLAKLVYAVMNHMKKKSEAKGKPDLNVLFIYNMPFRALAKMTGGMVSMKMVRGIVNLVNGHISGLGMIISGYFQNQRENKAYEKKL